MGIDWVMGELHAFLNVLRISYCVFTRHYAIRNTQYFINQSENFYIPKERVMRKFLILLGTLLLLFFAAGCGSAETAVPAEPDTATESDTEVQSVAGKPQLIEFYADW